MPAPNAKTLKRPRNPGLVSEVLQHGNYDAQTVSLLKFNDIDASPVFYDEIAARLWTNFGGAETDTAQSVFGGSSGKFDGVNEYALADGSADYVFGTGDWTIDFRFRMTVLPASNYVLVDFREATNGIYPAITMDLLGKISFLVNSGNRITGTTSLSINTWYHIAVAKATGNTKMFLNGVQEGATYVDANSYLCGPLRPCIGTRGLNPQAFYLSGWLDELRISKGIARWTANFTPPVAEYPHA